MLNKIDRRKVLLSSMAVTTFGLTSKSYAAPAPRDLDPDLSAIISRMTRVQPDRGPSLSLRQKHLVKLAAATAAGFTASFAAAVKAALHDGVKPIEIKEAIYQCTPYAGISRVEAVLAEANRILEEAGITLPLPSAATVTDADRLEKGKALQISIAGERIHRMHQTAAPQERALLVDDLSSYCFGDFYTRKVLDLKDRELITFTVIAALGGAESQLQGHTNANITVGNTRQNLIDALQVAVAYLGFPRTLNALNVVRSTLKS